MAKPMSASQYISQLKKWGVAYKEFRDGWATHNRAVSGNPWGGVNGVMLHHTGSDGDSRNLLWNGRSELPGPLCHAGIDDKGLVWLIGWGRANHAGKGDDDVLRRVVAEDYSGVLKPNEANTDGNTRFYGVEVDYSGSHGMTKSQYNSMITWAAAICDFHDWTAKSVIGHGEWQPGKWDPGYKRGTMMDMNAVRNDIADLLEKGPGKAASPPATKPTAKVYDLKVGDTVRIGNSTLKVTEVK